MRRLSKQERVQFEGRNLSLNTIKSYAANKKHPLHSKAKVFLEKKNQKSWTQKVEESTEDLPTWGPALATPVQLVLGKAPKAIGKMMLSGTRSPSKSFAEGFNQAADFEPEKLKQSVTKAAKAVFGIKDKEADKVGQALTESRQQTLRLIAEASKDIAFNAKEGVEGLLWGTFNAAISGVGKVVGGSAFLVGQAVDVQIRSLHSKEGSSSEEKFEQALAQFYGNIGKDELVAVSRFIDDEGVFDEKGYKREMEKAFKEIKRNLDKFIKSQNEKHKNKKASTTRVAYLHYRRVMSRSRGY